MATTQNTHDGTGSKRDFPFTFPYLSTSDVKVKLDGTTVTDTTKYTFPNATTLEFVSGEAPDNGAKVIVFRDTNTDTRKATFYPGSSIRAGDLNDNADQTLYTVQEVQNNAMSTLGDATMLGNLNIGNFKVVSVGTPTAGTDATNKTYVDGAIDTAMESDVLAGTDIAKSVSGGRVTINHSVTGADVALNKSGGEVLQDITVTAQGHVTSVGTVDLDSRYLAAGSNLDSRYYTISQLDGGELNDLYYTETEIDTNHYTKTQADAAFFKQDSTESITSGNTWSNSDTKVATTAAIDARIIDLIDDVGGFVAIANETSFPAANPDINNAAGTLVSIKALASNLTSNGSGVATITDGAGSGNTVTINGLANSTTYAAGFGMILETTSTLHTYAFHRQVPKATEVTTVAANATAVSTVATNVADVNNFADLYQIKNTQPDKRADNSNLVEGDLWFDSNADVLKAYTGSAYITVVPSQTVLDQIEIVSGEVTFAEDLGSVAESVTTSTGNNIDTVADNITNINTVAGANSSVTSVGANIANVNAVNNNSSNINTVASAATNINTVAGNNSNITTVATNSTNINTVAGSIANINTVANGVTSVNRYAVEYTIGGTAPGSPQQGYLWFNTGVDVLQYWTGSAWSGITSGITSLAEDSTPELTGHLDCNDKNLTEVGTVSGDNLQLDFGTL